MAAKGAFNKLKADVLEKFYVEQSVQGKNGLLSLSVKDTGILLVAVERSKSLIPCLSETWTYNQELVHVIVHLRLLYN